MLNVDSLPFFISSYHPPAPSPALAQTEILQSSGSLRNSTTAILGLSTCLFLFFFPNLVKVFKDEFLTLLLISLTGKLVVGEPPSSSLSPPVSWLRNLKLVSEHYMTACCIFPEGHLTSKIDLVGLDTEAEVERTFPVPLETFFYLPARWSAASSGILFTGEPARVNTLETPPPPTENIKIYPVSITLPLMAQLAVPHPLGLSVVQPAHLQILLENPHPGEVDPHHTAGRHRQAASTPTMPDMGAPPPSLPIGSVVDVDALGAGEAVVDLNDMVVLNVLPGGSVVQLPLVALAVSQLLA